MDARKRAFAVARCPSQGRADGSNLVRLYEMNFGITLSNRGIPVGLCSARDLLALADAVEACPVMDSALR